MEDKKIKALCLNGLDYLIDKLNTIFVKTEMGKGLSTNDYTTVEKEKLAGLENPTIKTVKVNDSPLSPDASKSVNIDLTGYALKQDISQVYKYKGSVNNYSELPTTEQEVGDTYNIANADKANDINAGDNVSWNGEEWDKLGGSVDISLLATKKEIENKVDKEAGKGLSTNDYTTAEKEKLAGLEKVEEITNEEIEALFN